MLGDVHVNYSVALANDPSNVIFLRIGLLSQSVQAHRSKFKALQVHSPSSNCELRAC